MAIPNPTPGEMLLLDFLQPIGLSQNRLARAIGVPPRRVNEIVLGKRAITADTDLRLARYFGLSERLWLGVQADFDLLERRREIGEASDRMLPHQPAAAPMLAYAVWTGFKRRRRAPSPIGSLSRRAAGRGGQHRAWGRKVEARAAHYPLDRGPPRPPRGPRDKLRIGLMSSDLRNHPVSYFALPLIEHYDRSKVELFCYSFYPGPADGVQKLIAEQATGFRLMPEIADPVAAQRIADDRLDILFDLGGSTRYNRPEILAYRPAPVQVSWLGYPHSAGLGTIDGIVVDPYIKPTDPALLIEKPFELPESWVCLGRLGFTDIPIEPDLPQDRRGCITFGTMNNPNKYTPATIARWAAVMREVENSRFLFVRPEGGAASFRGNLRQQFKMHGVEPHRIEFEVVRGQHMQQYNRIDICLDTGPQTGGTTTCESLWMGVPVVTLVGEAFFERLSYSNLCNAGLQHLCAPEDAGFISVSSALAARKSERVQIRKEMRIKIKNSTLGNVPRWVGFFANSCINF